MKIEHKHYSASNLNSLTEICKEISINALPLIRTYLVKTFHRQLILCAGPVRGGKQVIRAAWRKGVMYGKRRRSTIII